MALPQQQFNTLQDVVAYTNTFFIPNGRKDINGTEGNNILNGLAKFIKEYTVNGALDGADVISAGGVVTLTRPINYITNTAPTSITWPDNIQKEYYINNTLAQTLTNVKTYYDINLTPQTTIPGKATLHIVQLENGNWAATAVVNPGSGGGGGGGNGQGNLF